MLLRVLRSLRLREVLILQGSPLLGLVLGAGATEPFDLISGARLCLVSVLLVAAIWMFNDWADFAADQGDATRADRGQVSRGTTLALSAALLAASFLAGAALPWRTQALAALIAALGVVYSAPWPRAKAIPLAGALVHLSGGLAHFLLGRSVRGPIDANSLWLGAFVALVFTAGHGVQEVQDHEADARAGVSTGAVTFGARRMFLVACALFGAAYADLFVLCWLGLVPQPVAWVALGVLPLHVAWSCEALAGGLASRDVARLRERYRVLFVLIGVAMLAGALHGRR